MTRLYLHYSVESTAKPVKHLSGKVTPGCGDTCNQVKRSEIQIPIRRKMTGKSEKYGAKWVPYLCNTTLDSDLLNPKVKYSMSHF